MGWEKSSDNLFYPNFWFSVMVVRAFGTNPNSAYGVKTKVDASVPTVFLLAA